MHNSLFCIDFPLPPSINAQYATVNGHRVSTASARKFKQQVKKLLSSAEIRQTLTPRLVEDFREHYLALSLAFFFASPLKRDLDGGLKITQDALCESLGINDNRIVSVHLSKFIDPLHPHVSVELEALEDWTFDEEYVLIPS